MRLFKVRGKFCSNLHFNHYELNNTKKYAVTIYIRKLVAPHVDRYIAKIKNIITLLSVLIIASQMEGCTPKTNILIYTNDFRNFKTVVSKKRFKCNETGKGILIFALSLK